MATKQQIFVNNTLPTDKLLAGNGTDTLSEITLGSGLSLSSGTLTATGGGGGGSLIPLTTTFADCENTASEIDIITVTIPANTLAVGDIISILGLISRLQNNSTGTITLFTRMTINGNDLYTTNNTTISQFSNIYRIISQQILIVTDVTTNNATIKATNSGVNQTMLPLPASFNLGGTGTGQGADISDRMVTSIPINSSITITLKATWNFASPLTYIRPEQVQAYIIKKAV